MTTIEQNINLNLTRPLSTLLKGESISIHIEDRFIYEDLKGNTDAFLNMLYNAGYFTACSDFYNYNMRDIRIVNHELLHYMQRIYLRWFKNKGQESILHDHIKYFIEGYVIGVQETLQTIVLSSLIFHDVTTKRQESFCHGLVIGLSLAADGRYTINSNRESGYGRYDIAWFPKNPTLDPGIL